MREIIVEIDEETGEVKLNNLGFSGAECLSFTKALEESLGKIQDRHLKPEYKAQVQRQQRREQRI